MRFAIPTDTDNQNPMLSPVFGRSRHFVIYDVVNQLFETIDNPYFEDKMRVGANVSWLLSQHRVTGYIAYDFGLKIQNQASENNIQLVLIKNTVKSLKDFKNLTSKD